MAPAQKTRGVGKARLKPAAYSSQTDHHQLKLVVPCARQRPSRLQPGLPPCRLAMSRCISSLSALLQSLCDYSLTFTRAAPWPIVARPRWGLSCRRACTARDAPCSPAFLHAGPLRSVRLPRETSDPGLQTMGKPIRRAAARTAADGREARPRTTHPLGGYTAVYLPPRRDLAGAACHPRPHGPVIASVSPVVCRLTNSVVPSGENTAPANSE